MDTLCSASMQSSVVDLYYENRPQVSSAVLAAPRNQPIDADG